MEKNNEVYNYIVDEKKKGIITIRYPLNIARAHMNNTGIYYDFDIINNESECETRRICIETDIHSIGLNSFKIFLSICRYITENKYNLTKEFETKYKHYDMTYNKMNLDVVKKLLKEKTTITIECSEILRLLEKNNNKDSRKNLRNVYLRDFKEFVKDFVQTIIIDDKAVTYDMMIVPIIEQSGRKITFEIKDLFMYYMFNKYICVHCTKELLECRSLDVINLSLYISSFKYTNTANKNSKNVVDIETVLKKIGKTIDDYKNLEVEDFIRKIRKIFGNALKKIDKDATFTIDTKNCKTVSSVINRGQIKFEMPIFKNGRLKHNENRMKKNKKYCDDELPLK